MAEAEKAHKNALEAKDKDGAANARLRIVAAMLGVQFGEPDVDEPTPDAASARGERRRDGAV